MEMFHGQVTLRFQLINGFFQVIVQDKEYILYLMVQQFTKVMGLLVISL